MSNKIGGLGLKVTIIASPVFPQGFTVDKWADDSDPLIIGDLEITQTAMGVNGDLISWNKAVPIPVELSVIPNSEDDQNLKILINSNRAARNKVSTQDDITMIVSYPNGKIQTLTGGVVKQGAPAQSVTSESRLKTATFSFEFENIV